MFYLFLHIFLCRQVAKHHEDLTSKLRESALQRISSHKQAKFPSGYTPGPHKNLCHCSQCKTVPCEESPPCTQLNNTNISEQLKAENNDEEYGIQRIVCYGLGSLSESRSNSIIQTALLLHLQKLCHDKPTVEIFDPVFENNDETLFQEYGFKLIPENEECCRTVDQLTLFYVPHGSWGMYNNILWANWNFYRLSNIIFVGNNFQNLDDSFVDDVFRGQYFYIYLVLKHGLCVTRPLSKLISSYDVELAGTALITFCQEKFPVIHDPMWTSYPEPTYLQSDREELVRSKCSLKLIDPLTDYFKLMM